MYVRLIRNRQSAARRFAAAHAVRPLVIRCLWLAGWLVFDLGLLLLRRGDWSADLALGLSAAAGVATLGLLYSIASLLRCLRGRQLAAFPGRLSAGQWRVIKQLMRADSLTVTQLRRRAYVPTALVLAALWRLKAAGMLACPGTEEPLSALERQILPVGKYVTYRFTARQVTGGTWESLEGNSPAIIRFVHLGYLGQPATLPRTRLGTLSVRAEKDGWEITHPGLRRHRDGGSGWWQLSPSVNDQHFIILEALLVAEPDRTANQAPSLQAASSSTQAGLKR